jgi:hypothetical protein
MTKSAHLHSSDRQSELWRCKRAATAVEFALAAALLATAVTAVRSPRYQMIKDEPCSLQHGRCAPASAAVR